MGIRLTQPESPFQSCSQMASRARSSSRSGSAWRTTVASSQLRWAVERSSSNRLATARSTGLSSSAQRKTRAQIAELTQHRFRLLVGIAGQPQQQQLLEGAAVVK